MKLFTITEIQTAVRAGRTVYVGSKAYQVKRSIFRDGTEQWLVVCINGHAISLTSVAGKPNIKESDCFTDDAKQ